jgi:murein DD-endopeptidase MepM/ murein hydrolase activator NlpD
VRGAAALLLLAVLAALPAGAQPTREWPRAADQEAAARRAEAERAAAASADAAARARALAERRVAAAARALAADAALEEALTRYAEAETAWQAAQEAADRHARALAPLLPLALRLAEAPEETLLARAVPPEEALRGLIALRHVARRLDAELAGLRAAAAAAEAAARRRAAEAEALRAAQAAARAATAAVEAELAVARAALTEAEAAERAAAARAAAAAAGAADLTQMLARVEADSRPAVREAARRPPPLSAREETALPSPPTGRSAPVAGRVVRAFGAAGPEGPARGLTYAAPPGAQVVSPCAGRIVFAAPFRSYGPLLIVDCGGGYHFVLAGLERLDVSAGARVLAGEPVGRLGEADADGSGRARLYLELRREGRPIDPRPFLAAAG